MKKFSSCFAAFAVAFSGTAFGHVSDDVAWPHYQPPFSISGQVPLADDAVAAGEIDDVYVSVVSEMGTLSTSSWLGEGGWSLQDFLESSNGSIVVPVEGGMALAVPSQTSPSCSGMNKDDLKDGWEIVAYRLDQSAAAAMNIFASAELAANHEVIVYHLVWYVDLRNNEDEVIGRCGAGIALNIRTSNIDASVDASLPMIAARAQLNQGEAHYRLGTFGLSGGVVNTAMPLATGLSRFDTGAFASLMRSMDAIQSGMAAGEIVVTPRLVSMTSSNLGRIPHLLTQVFALRQIAAGRSCRQAQAAVPQRSDTSDAAVETFYREFTGRVRPCQNLSINQAERSRAAQLLNSFGIGSN